MLHQTFEPRDLILVLMLVILEGLLSIDNALVLGLIARRLPEQQRTHALTYGLIGAFAFRLAATISAVWLLRWNWVKLLGGFYLVYVVVKHFVRPDNEKDNTQSLSQGRLAFWSSVLSIELTDIAFATDSILAGIALVGPGPRDSTIHPKMWVILFGGMIGVVLMRVAAWAFIALMKRFPRFEATAYLLVLIVGLKLLADWGFNGDEERVNFQSPSAYGFWIFWGLMTACVGLGFLPARPKAARPSGPSLNSDQSTTI